MAHKPRPTLLAVPIFAAALLLPLWPVRTTGPAARASAAPPADTLVLHARGTSQRVAGSAPDHFVFEVDVFNASDENVGTVTYDMRVTSLTHVCPGLPPGDSGTFDLVSTFHLADGDLVNRAVLAFATDGSTSDYPGFRLVGVHSDKDTIVSDKSTGAYAGRTGRLRMSGWHDVNRFPDEDTFDDFFRVELNPRS